VARGGSFEGSTTIGVGVGAAVFRVFVLPGPDAGSRLVIDIAINGDNACSPGYFPQPSVTWESSWTFDRKYFLRRGDRA